MKPLLALAGIFVSLSAPFAAHAAEVENWSCVKKDPWSYHARYWIEIDGSTGQLQYGVGIESQLTEVRFESVVSKDAGGQWVSAANDPFDVRFFPKKGDTYRLEIRQRPSTKVGFSSDGYRCTVTFNP